MSTHSLNYFTGFHSAELMLVVIQPNSFFSCTFIPPVKKNSLSCLRLLLRAILQEAKAKVTGKDSR